MPVASEAGTRNSIFSVLPRTFCAAVALIETPGPSHVEETRRLTLPGTMDPEGKPDPVTLALVEPAAAVLGLVEALRRTVDACDAVAARRTAAASTRRAGRRPSGSLTKKRTERKPVASSFHAEGSGTEVALMTARSPSLRKPVGSVMDALKPEVIRAEVASFKDKFVTLKSPESTASVAL